MLSAVRSALALALGRLQHTHEVPVQQVEGQQLGPAVGSCGNPTVGGHPHAPPRQKHPPTHTLQRAPCPGRALNPDKLPCKGLVMLGWRRCCWKMVPMELVGYFWAHQSALRSRNGGRSSGGHCYRCLAPLHRASRSSLSIIPPGQSSSDEKQPLCLSVGMWGTKRCEII